ncbi:uncharacterized protein BDW70DRAFT_156855 [Aspergillus foveolatus]|uniref:uncharacterized protein n=1 Tax=Aspergillus foveolatus TaxID=210207 RepID=UPI003CCD8A63
MAFSEQPPARPRRPIALRPETIARAEIETIITVRNSPEPWHSLDYIVTHHDGAVLFTVHGHPWTLSQRQDFRDASGLPLFELRCRWYDSSVMELKLPGGTAISEPLLTAKCRVAVQKPRAVMRFHNACALMDARTTRGYSYIRSPEQRRMGGATVDDETVMEILAMDVDNLVQVAVIEDQRVAFIDRVSDPEILAQGQKPPFRFRPMWRVRVARGVDLALIAVAVVIVGQQVAGPAL